MSVKKLDDFSPLPGLLPAGKFVVSGVRSETAYARAVRNEFSYLVDEPETSDAAKSIQTAEQHAERH